MCEERMRQCGIHVDSFIALHHLLHKSKVWWAILLFETAFLGPTVFSQVQGTGFDDLTFLCWLIRRYHMCMYWSLTTEVLSFNIGIH